MLERAPVVGGMAGSFEVAGVRVDHGSHRLHPATPAPLLAALRDLLGEDLQVRHRNGRIRLLDRWVGFPLRTGDLVRHMPRRFAARAGRDALLQPVRRARSDTFAEVVRAGLGPTVLDAFYAPYARKLWGVGPDELAGDLARRRVSAASPAAILRRLARGRRPEGRTFLYPRRGFGSISEALADAAVAAGAELRLGVGVAGLDRQAHGGGGSWLVRLEGGGSLEAQHVWSTAPVPALARMISSVPDDVRQAADSLSYRAMILLYFVLDRPRWTSFDAHYFPGLETCVSRLSEPRNYRDNPDDPPDRTVLCAEIPCDVGEGIWTELDEESAGLVAMELEEEAGASFPLHTEVAIRRLPRVYPVYRPGYAEHLATLESWAAGLDGLLTFGRQGLFTPDNTHHALAMGWAAASALHPDGTFDAQAWDRARNEFRSFVVED